MAKKTVSGTEQPADESVPSLADEQAKAVEEAEAAAEVSGTGNPVLEPDKSKMPAPGTTGDLDVVSTDDATSLNPNVTISGTKPDGKGGQELLSSVDPAVANAALITTPINVKPETSSLPVEQAGPAPDSGEVLFKCTVHNEPFYTGGAMKFGQSYVMSKEEAETLVQLKAGNIESGNVAPASDDNAKTDGSDV